MFDFSSTFIMIGVQANEKTFYSGVRRGDGGRSAKRDRKKAAKWHVPGRYPYNGAEWSGMLPEI